MEWLIANNYQNESIAIKGDSQLVILQIKGNFKVKAPNIIPLYRDAMSLIPKFKYIQFELIPRDQNKEADRLSNLAYQEQCLGVYMSLCGQQEGELIAKAIKTNSNRDYEGHTIMKHGQGHPCYPSKADLEKLGLKA